MPRRPCEPITIRSAFHPTRVVDDHVAEATAEVLEELRHHLDTGRLDACLRLGEDLRAGLLQQVDNISGVDLDPGRENQLIDHVDEPKA